MHKRRFMYLVAHKSLARPGRKQARKNVRQARDFNNIEMRAVIGVFFLQGKAPKEIHAIMTEILPCFLPGRAKDLSASLYYTQCSYRSLFSHYAVNNTQFWLHVSVFPNRLQASSVNPRFKNASVYEQIFRTQSVSDDVLCYEHASRQHRGAISWQYQCRQYS